MLDVMYYILSYSHYNFNHIYLLVVIGMILLVKCYIFGHA